MKFLVPLKRVFDPDTRIRLKADGTGVDTDGVKYAINPFDAIALEEALRARDLHGSGEVVVVSIGTSDSQEQLRAGLAMGADRALLVRHDAEIDSLAVAKILAAVYKKEQPNLVLMGKQAIDDDSNQVGQMLAGLLGIGQATFISKLTLPADANEATCCRETDAGLEIVNVTLPAVITADLRLNEPRYVTALGIMKAKKKPLEEVTPADLGVDATSRVRTLKLGLAPKRSAGIRVQSVDELLQKLRAETLIP
ncbi:MAG: electron transfer flavoprotein subunit beta/FixA family protein [Planctomycetaceae bacterium]